MLTINGGLWIFSCFEGEFGVWESKILIYCYKSAKVLESLLLISDSYFETWLLNLSPFFKCLAFAIASTLPLSVISIVEEKSCISFNYGVYLFAFLLKFFLSEVSTLWGVVFQSGLFIFILPLRKDFLDLNLLDGYFSVYSSSRKSSSKLEILLLTNRLLACTWF